MRESGHPKEKRKFTVALTTAGLVRTIHTILVKVAPVRLAHALLTRRTPELRGGALERITSDFRRLVLTAHTICLSITHVLAVDARISALLSSGVAEELVGWTLPIS